MWLIASWFSYTPFVCSLDYYGLSMNAALLGGDLFLNFALISAIEIPAYSLAWLVNKVCTMDAKRDTILELHKARKSNWEILKALKNCNINKVFIWREVRQFKETGMTKVGRKWSLCISFLVGGGAVLPIGFISKDVRGVHLALNLVGKLGVTSAFGIVYLYTAELMPTPIRSATLGLCAMASRIGAIIAPFLIQMSRQWEPLPMVVFGGCSILSGILGLSLPETQGRPLPQTLHDAEHLQSVEPIRHEIAGETRPLLADQDD
ncbi:unnamed protein product [Darwinula stevensoni]|uniref:Uncharacterized protein n=1 Tax=Darwinula stevensoni TaxID=69355 RepID=A0A7R9A1Z9_9CRUS|nr:unnamed protein product [Darwinula stevensoni]CAG0878605.1 unnamed protein product [Darwinula stevensoni]